MGKLCFLFYGLLQCTWGSVQTCIGLLLFLKYHSCPHRFFYGAVHTRWKREDGISLGLFIFSPECGCGAQGGPLAQAGESLPGRPKCGAVVEEAGRMTVHEYGHTIQSLMLGPLYLVVIGIPSALWANCKRYIRLRENYGVPYSFLFTEVWADYLGEKAVKWFCSRK